jgi:hypothetical protein
MDWGEPEQPFVPSVGAACSFRVVTKQPAGWSESGERVFETNWSMI